MNPIDPESDPRRTTCSEAIDFLQEFMDGADPVETPEIVSHRAECAPCREEFQLAKMVLQVPLSQSVLPSFLIEKTVRAVSRDRRNRMVRRRAAWVMMPLAASLLVVFFWPEGQPVRIQENIPAQTAVVMAPTVAVEQPMMLDESISKARVAIESISEKIVAVRPDMNVSLPKSDLKPQPDPAWDRLADAGDGLKSGVKPLATSAKRAVTMFFNATETLSFADSPRKNRP